MVDEANNQKIDPQCAMCSPEQLAQFKWAGKIHWLNLCRGVRLPNKCPGYDNKQSDGEVPVII